MMVVTAGEPFSQEEAMDVSNSDFLSHPKLPIGSDHTLGE